jgi:hypothetical protein
MKTMIEMATESQMRAQGTRHEVLGWKSAKTGSAEVLCACGLVFAAPETTQTLSAWLEHFGAYNRIFADDTPEHALTRKVQELAGMTTSEVDGLWGPRTAAAVLAKIQGIGERIREHVARPSIHDEREARATELEVWAVRCFGEDEAHSIAHRALRMFEEACEVLQAAGVGIELLRTVAERVYAGEPGDLDQELGGLGVTTLLLARAAGLSADIEEQREYSRVLSMPDDHFAARNKAKIDAGLGAPEILHIHRMREQIEARPEEFPQADPNAPATAETPHAFSPDATGDVCQYCGDSSEAAVHLAAEPVDEFERRMRDLDAPELTAEGRAAMLRELADEADARIVAGRSQEMQPGIVG